MFLNLLFSLFLLNGQTNAKITNQLVLQEDENLKITLLYLSEIDISDVDGLKLKIENKTNCDLQITSVSYFLNGYYGLEENANLLNMGKYGRGNQFNLLGEKFDLKSKSGLREKAIIQPKSSIYVGKSFTSQLIGYLTGFGDTLYDGKKLTDDDICVMFQFKLDYSVQGEKLTLECINEPFSFTWISPECVSEVKIKKCIREALLKPDVNPVVLGKFMGEISTEDLIQGILAREKNDNSYETKAFLRELARRNAIPDKRITDVFIRKFEEKDWVDYEELLLYWDNAFLDKILNSKIPHVHTKMVLEEYANQWSTNSKNQKKVYDYFVKSLNFRKVDKLAPEDMVKWSTDVKTIAMSRYPDFINYLKSFLDDETEFTIENWSKYYYSGILPKDAKPDLIQVRVCDVALVAILRASNQIELKLRDESGPKGYSLTMKNDILSLETTNRITGKGQPQSFDLEGLYGRKYLGRDINLNFYETIIKLTPEIKEKINHR